MRAELAAYRTPESLGRRRCSSAGAREVFLLAQSWRHLAAGAGWEAAAEPRSALERLRGSGQRATRGSCLEPLFGLRLGRRAAGFAQDSVLSALLLRRLCSGPWRGAALQRVRAPGSRGSPFIVLTASPPPSPLLSPSWPPFHPKDTAPKLSRC